MRVTYELKCYSYHVGNSCVKNCAVRATCMIIMYSVARISPVDPLPGQYIPPTQEINTIPANQCQTFDYTIMSDLNLSKGRLNLFIPEGPGNTHILIELLSCPTGLHLVDNECQHKSCIL